MRLKCFTVIFCLFSFSALTEVIRMPAVSFKPIPGYDGYYFVDQRKAYQVVVQDSQSSCGYKAFDSRIPKLERDSLFLSHGNWGLNEQHLQICWRAWANEAAAEGKYKIVEMPLSAERQIGVKLTIRDGESSFYFYREDNSDMTKFTGINGVVFSSFEKSDLNNMFDYVKWCKSVIRPGHKLYFMTLTDEVPALEVEPDQVVSVTEFAAGAGQSTVNAEPDVVASAVQAPKIEKEDFGDWEKITEADCSPE